MLWSQRTLGAKPEQGGERRESGRATKKRTAHRDGASRPGYLCCGHDVRLGRLSRLARDLGVCPQHLGAKPPRYRAVAPEPHPLGLHRLAHRLIAVYAGRSILWGGTFGLITGFVFA